MVKSQAYKKCEKCGKNRSYFRTHRERIFSRCSDCKTDEHVVKSHRICFKCDNKFSYIYNNEKLCGFHYKHSYVNPTPGSLSVKSRPFKKNKAPIILTENEIESFLILAINSPEI